MIVQLAYCLVLYTISLQTSHRALQSQTLLISLLYILPAALQLDTKLMLLGSAGTQLLLHFSLSYSGSFQLFSLSLEVISLVALNHLIQFLFFFFQCLLFFLKLPLHLLCVFFIGLKLEFDILDCFFDWPALIAAEFVDEGVPLLA